MESPLQLMLLIAGAGAVALILLNAASSAHQQLPDVSGRVSGHEFAWGAFVAFGTFTHPTVVFAFGVMQAFA